MSDNIILYDLYKQQQKQIDLLIERQDMICKSLNKIELKICNTNNAIRALMLELNQNENIKTTDGYEFYRKHIMIEENKINNM